VSGCDVLPRSYEGRRVENPIVQGDVGLALVVGLGLDQFTADIKFAFGLAESAAEGLPCAWVNSGDTQS